MNGLQDWPSHSAELYCERLWLYRRSLRKGWHGLRMVVAGSLGQSILHLWKSVGNVNRMSGSISAYRAAGNSGFTLVELMIAMVVSGLIIGAIYSAYTVQQATYTVQDQVMEMQQNLRAALEQVAREVRMAGLDPFGTAGAGLTLASPGRLSFTLDRTDDTGNGSADGDTNDANEAVDFGFSPADDADNDGIPDSGGAAIFRRQVGGGGYQPLAESIQAVEFNYILADGSSTTAPSSAQYKQVRAVQISMLARARGVDRNFTDTNSYRAASGTVWGPYNDNFRRRLLVVTIQCRNLEME